MAKIMKNAKATGQDKATTMKQLAQVLNPGQQAKLKQMVEAKATTAH